MIQENHITENERKDENKFFKFKNQFSKNQNVDKKQIIQKSLNVSKKSLKKQTIDSYAQTCSTKLKNYFIEFLCCL